MRVLLLAATALIACAGTASADQRVEARLAGHAVLPALTLTPPPADAPPDARVSGKFTGGARNDRPGSIPSATGPAPNGRPTGLASPFIGQPVQGFSGIKPVAGEAGAYWVLTDNGFGNKRNSGDALLMIHKLRPDFRAGAEGGKVVVERTIFLSDPERIIPFRLSYEGTEARYLTGADFDLESIQPIQGGGFWLGDEFGPFLIQVDAGGRVRQVVETQLDGQVLRGPDHPALSLGATPTAGADFRVRRSGGYEGMAMLPDGSRLWALLEQPLFAPGSDRAEGEFIRMLEFDTARSAWTGRSLKYRLEQGATAIGDFNFIDERRALVIERDNGEGDPSLACADGKAPPACFHAPARFKRVYLIDLGAADAEGFVKKLAHIDLMDIRDPEGLARQRGDRAANVPQDRFGFPFFTIEDVAMVDAEHIIVANDNNLPGSAGRHLTRADDNEFILLHVPELLKAR
ncbi:esterase-like activity of phytase family protein [Roseomonas marmotae]|uniref:Esterase-like activity of phytase family protein n=1 Tax=Roseomonas marmotae TaxID=2768161 RepID=A0ABS3KES7_9PROT|nr:esterase-like activity of phytase family protein [Roseomonas marmotae]MBO1075982.1 esterase-like activity of phytase family protein [Roseomonas marmotae]QTI80116.1 esterase-like activity of phytase family protein [Roseomonas marmotae]